MVCIIYSVVLFEAQSKQTHFDFKSLLILQLEPQAKEGQRKENEKRSQVQIPKRSHAIHI